MHQSLYIGNSLTGKKTIFKPIHEGFVGMYACGPTVYNYVHLGNCRTFVSFDLVFRYLMYLGYKVRYVRNITDVGHLENDADEGEDKIAKRAKLEQLEPMEIVQKYVVDFHHVLEKLNTLPPSIEPTATGHIIEQIQMIQQILKEGYAYEVNGSIYFDVPKYNEKYPYGELSGRKIEELIAGTRVLDGQDEKRSPLDFALWKKASPEHIMRWPSPWSDGFPGWHLECSVMSTKYLGSHFDIHGGGMDLKFPHHECEIAQSRSIHDETPVNYWIHGNMLTLNGRKMSKSAGNVLSPNELFNGENSILAKAYHPMVVRFFMLQAHYSSTLDFTNEALEAAEKGFDRLMEAVKALETAPTSNHSSEDIPQMIQGFYDAMNDDFNSPILIAKMFDSVKFINSLKINQSNINEKDKSLLINELYGFVFKVLGLKFKEEENNQKLAGVMDLVIDLRQEARAKKDFDTSDKIRDGLSKIGITIKDAKEGTTWM